MEPHSPDDAVRLQALGDEVLDIEVFEIDDPEGLYTTGKLYLYDAVTFKEMKIIMRDHKLHKAQLEIVDMNNN